MIDRNEVLRIAALAQLDFDDAAAERMARDLSQILEYVDQIASVDVSSVETTTPDEPLPLRDDVIGPSLPPETVAGNAPEFARGHFVVPRVIGGEP
ncbi:MAG: Asp-tRNA(Asn)/Glu-tRNA(Gln) amidotransferase subunit GatC [Thermoanaerobaculia bacterium]